VAYTRNQWHCLCWNWIKNWYALGRGNVEMENGKWKRKIGFPVVWGAKVLIEISCPGCRTTNSLRHVEKLLAETRYRCCTFYGRIHIHFISGLIKPLYVLESAVGLVSRWRAIKKFGALCDFPLLCGVIKSLNLNSIFDLPQLYDWRNEINLLVST